MEKTVARAPFRSYIGMGIVTGAMLSSVALVVLGVFALLRLVGVPVEMPPIRDLLVACPVLLVSYFLLSTLGAVALWLLYPLRGSLIGWVLRGAVLGPVAYGTITCSDVLLYAYTGVSMLGFESIAEARGFVAVSVPVFAALGGLIGGPVLYVKVGRQTGLTRP